MAIFRYNPDGKPLATYTMVGINVTIAVIDIATNGMLERMFWARGLDIQYGEYWRLFTSGWVHGSLIHIAFNAYGIWLLGSLFERLHGPRAFLVVYFTALMGGSALAMVFYDIQIPLLGASGAAYGLFGAVIAFFYVKGGGLRGLWENPVARQLLIWLGIGVYISLQPGISFLGHLGGFVPGLLLGLYYEHRYQRRHDVYHVASVAVAMVMIAGLSVFACYPFTRGSLYAVQALKAMQADDRERAHELLDKARERPRDEGASLLIRHLEIWERGNAFSPREFDKKVLAWPLTHPRGVATAEADRVIPFDFLTPERVRLPDIETEGETEDDAED